MDPNTSSMSIVRGCLPVVLIVLALVGGAFAFVVWRAGGVTHIDDFVVNGALNSLETDALNRRPDGVAEVDLRVTFDRVRSAVSNDNVNVDALYAALRDYEERFKGTGVKPSNGEMTEFLAKLDGAVLSPSPVR